METKITHLCPDCLIDVFHVIQLLQFMDMCPRKQFPEKQTVAAAITRKSYTG